MERWNSELSYVVSANTLTVSKAALINNVDAITQVAICL